MTFKLFLGIIKNKITKTNLEHDFYFIIVYKNIKSYFSYLKKVEARLSKKYKN